MKKKVEKELQYGIRSYIAQRTFNYAKDRVIVQRLSSEWKEYADRVNDRQSLVVVNTMQFE